MALTFGDLSPGGTSIFLSTLGAIPSPHDNATTMSIMHIISSFQDWWTFFPFLEEAYDDFGEVLFGCTPWAPFHDDLFLRTLVAMAMHGFPHFLLRVQEHIDHWHPHLHIEVLQFSTHLIPSHWVAFASTHALVHDPTHLDHIVEAHSHVVFIDAPTPHESHSSPSSIVSTLALPVVAEPPTPHLASSSTIVPHAYPHDLASTLPLEVLTSPPPSSSTHVPIIGEMSTPPICEPSPLCSVGSHILEPPYLDDMPPHTPHSIFVEAWPSCHRVSLHDYFLSHAHTCGVPLFDEEPLHHLHLMPHQETLAPFLPVYSWCPTLHAYFTPWTFSSTPALHTFVWDPGATCDTFFAPWVESSPSTCTPLPYALAYARASSLASFTWDPGPTLSHGYFSWAFSHAPCLSTFVWDPGWIFIDIASPCVSSTISSLAFTRAPHVSHFMWDPGTPTWGPFDGSILIWDPGGLASS